MSTSVSAAMGTAPAPGTKVSFAAYGWCPTCGRSTGLLPGPVVNGVEQRRCEDEKHLVTSMPGYEHCDRVEADAVGVVDIPRI